MRCSGSYIDLVDINGSVANTGHHDRPECPVDQDPPWPGERIRRIHGEDSDQKDTLHAKWDEEEKAGLHSDELGRTGDPRSSSRLGRERHEFRVAGFSKSSLPACISIYLLERDLGPWPRC